MARADDSGSKQVGGAEAAFEALAASPKLSELSRLTLTTVVEAEKAPFADKAAYAEKAAELGLSHDDGETPFGNALFVLEHGPEDAAQAKLAAALVAHAMAEAPPRGDDETRARAGVLLRLATRHGIDALPLLERALGDDAVPTFFAIADAVRRADGHELGAISRAEAIVGAAALAGGAHADLTKLSAKLSGSLKDPLLVRVLSNGPGDEGTRADGERSRRIEGELTSPPRSVLRTVLLASTGALFALAALRALGALALVLRRPAEVVVTPKGIRLRAKTIVLGRTIREIDTQIDKGALVRATREVRYPRAGLYAGLFALAIGSYVGVSAFVDGARSASPSMLLTGLVVVALGIALDFALGAVRSGARGKCVVAFQPSRGSKVCLSGVDPKSADSALGLLRGA
jgi:hypothetical protein